MLVRVMTILLGVLLLTGFGLYTKESMAQLEPPIDIDLSDTANPLDFPLGIECGDPDFVFVTIFLQGALAKIQKSELPDGSHTVQVIKDPNFESVSSGRDFFDVARDPSTRNLFINQQSGGLAWRFDPSTLPESAWTAIPIVEQIVHPNVIYDPSFTANPLGIKIDEDDDGFFGEEPELAFADSRGIVFANGFIWISLTYVILFSDLANSIGIDDVTFSGVVRVNPTTLEVTRFSVVDEVFNPETFEISTLGTLNVDNIEPLILWIPDRELDKIYKFNTDSLAVVLTIDLPADSIPNHVDTFNDTLFVALNNFAPFSEILRINRVTGEIIDTLNTEAPVSLEGTFSVIVNNGLLVWTDKSAHVGIFDLSTEPPTPEIDESTGLPFFTTTFEGEEDIDSNHFGCVAVDGEFWFASRGSAKVGILPNSKFSVGVGVGRARPTGSGGGGTGIYRGRDFAFGNPDSANYDDIVPIFGEVLTPSGSLKVLAEINDNVGVKDANLIVGKNIYPMQRHDGSPSWWEGTVPSSDLPNSGNLDFRVVAKDYNDNVAEYSHSAKVPFGPATSATVGGASFVITPLTMGEVHFESWYSIVATSIRSDNTGTNPNPDLKITIKNTSDEMLQNIRLTLSPELRGKFLLSDYAIRSIDPNSEYTVSLKLLKPNVDAMNNPIPYNGQVIISVGNLTPYILELSGDIPNDSALLHSLFMKMVKDKADQRYRSFEIENKDTRISQNVDYEVTLGSGESMIKSADDELIITNNGNKPLKNVRIVTSSLSNHFIPDQNNIAYLPAGSFVKVKLISKMNDAASYRDLQGELLVVPDNGAPVTVPIHIGKKLADDKNSMYEVKTSSGNEVISNTADTIMIRNNSNEETIDNVRLILPRDLARVFSLGEYSFNLEPNSEKIINLQMRGTHDSNVKQIMNDYSGEIIIVSSDGMKKIVPVNIIWKDISSEHFLIYARDDVQELSKAAHVISFLEHNYAEAKSIVGGAESNAKIIIYMTSSLNELKLLSNALAPSTYIHDEDVGFVWSSSDDVNMLALKEFTYRTIMQNYPTYWTKQKISADNGSWLVDGISNYVAARVVGERGMIKDQLDAFVAEPTSFEWYGIATESKYGATYALFKFLAEKYGDGIIDKTLYYMGSGMISNHRCDTLEQCALLRAVYDANGMKINDKRYDMSFATIVQEWKDFVQESYGISEDKLVIANIP